jgi:phosphonate transport system substrate-binding protein
MFYQQPMANQTMYFDLMLIGHYDLINRTPGTVVTKAISSYMPFPGRKRIALNITFFIAVLFVIASILFPQIARSRNNDDKTPFYFAVSAMASPAETLANFTDFGNYLSEKLGQPVILKQRRTYHEINALLAEEQIQLAFTCTGGYLAGRKLFDLELLVIPIIKGTTKYRSYIVVKKNNTAASLFDLGNSVFAFTDPLSLSGKIYPTGRLNEAGILTKDFFKKSFFTASHDKSIEAVATGIADGAAVDSLIFDALQQQPNSFARQLKVLEESEDFGMPPVVVPPGLPPALKKRLIQIFLAMDKDPEGIKVLKSLDMDGFALPNPELYHSAVLRLKSVIE